MSELIAWFDLVTAPLLLTAVLFFKNAGLTYRIGAAILALGLFCQSFVVFVGLYQLDGWGQLWMLKDIGAGIIAIRGTIKVFLNK